MHDPLVVAFEVRRPWPRRGTDTALRWPSMITVWHREPGGHDAGEICKHYHHRYQDAGGAWRYRFHHRWRFHIWHWKIQIHALQRLRRRVLTRCAWCRGRHRKGDPVNVSHGWDGPRGHWWQGEPGVFHHDCSAIAGAHHTCVCAQPVLEHDGYGTCARCGHTRPYGITGRQLARATELAAIPAGARQRPQAAAGA